MTDTELHEEAVASLKSKRKFWQAAALYLGANSLLWLIWILTDRTTDNSIPWPAWVSIIWGFFLAIDAFKAYSSWPSKRITEQEIEREMRRLQPH